VQGGILYGNNEGIPAFRWYEKASGKSLVAKHPRDARILQDRLSAGRTGLLEEGSSYVNIYDGGARQSLFTISALGGERFFENVRGLSFLLLLVLSPIRLLRLVKDVTLDFVRDLWQRLVGRFDTRVGRRRRPFSILGSLFQIIASVVFRELQTFGVLLDIYRRVPAIYANFYGYDDVAHQLGPLDGESERVLRGIDGRIREIDAARRRFADRRPYDLFVLSDHGMSPCTPFQERYGETLGQGLAHRTGRDLQPRVAHPPRDKLSVGGTGRHQRSPVVAQPAAGRRAAQFRRPAHPGRRRTGVRPHPPPRPDPAQLRHRVTGLLPASCPPDGSQ
jgi:hypothetical protein